MEETNIQVSSLDSSIKYRLMLKTLRIKNFKGWQDTGEIRMAPITLFFGANSSGKSSIGQFLMLLKQTVENSDRKAVLYTGNKSSPVQLGSFHEMVFQRNIEKKIYFDYSWEIAPPLSIVNPLDRENYAAHQIHFAACCGITPDTGSSVLLDHMEYQLFGAQETLELSVKMERKNDSRSEYRLNTSHYALKRRQGRAWSPGPPVRFYGFPDEVVAYHQNADFVQTLNLQHENLFRSINYLGPIRSKAERLYSWSGNEPESVGYTGEHTIAALLAARGRKISFAPRQRSKSFKEAIAQKLHQMGLIENFKVDSIAAHRQEYEVKLQTKGTRQWVDLPDVGFGLSQVLPVLVQCLYAPSGSIIIIEQPELHLHPKAQSALADVFIDVIQSREHGRNRNIQLIIETHSEHFLRRLQRRIAEDQIKSDQVAAYFANTTKSHATLDPLKLDPYGHIQNWPADFFGEEMLDITEHAKAAMKKRLELNRQPL